VGGIFHEIDGGELILEIDRASALHR
jgi:hypothetical protein